MISLSKLLLLLGVIIMGQLLLDFPRPGNPFVSFELFVAKAASCKTENRVGHGWNPGVGSKHLLLFLEQCISLPVRPVLPSANPLPGRAQGAGGSHRWGDPPPSLLPPRINPFRRCFRVEIPHPEQCSMSLGHKRAGTGCANQRWIQFCSPSATLALLPASPTTCKGVKKGFF